MSKVAYPCLFRLTSTCCGVSWEMINKVKNPGTCSYVIRSIATVWLNSDANGMLTVGLSFLFLYHLQMTHSSETSMTNIFVSSLSSQIAADSISFNNFCSLHWPNSRWSLIISFFVRLLFVQIRTLCTSSVGHVSTICCLFVRGIAYWPDVVLTKGCCFPNIIAVSLSKSITVDDFFMAVLDSSSGISMSTTLCQNSTIQSLPNKPPDYIVVSTLRLEQGNISFCSFWLVSLNKTVLNPVVFAFTHSTSCYVSFCILGFHNTFLIISSSFSWSVISFFIPISSIPTSSSSGTAVVHRRGFIVILLVKNWSLFLLNCRWILSMPRHDWICKKPPQLFDHLAVFEVSHCCSAESFDMWPD